jgi:uncharacterized repeat protein (TIGR01451 family)
LIGYVEGFVADGTNVEWFTFSDVDHMVFDGTISLDTPGSYLVTIPLQRPFLYSQNNGSIVIMTETGFEAGRSFAGHRWLSHTIAGRAATTYNSGASAVGIPTGTGTASTERPLVRFIHGEQAPMFTFDYPQGYNFNLVAPGETVTYEFIVQNTGSVAMNLQGVSITSSNPAHQAMFTYELEPIAPTINLAAMQRLQRAKVTVTFAVPSTVANTNLGNVSALMNFSLGSPLSNVYVPLGARIERLPANPVVIGNFATATPNWQTSDEFMAPFDYAKDEFEIRSLYTQDLFLSRMDDIEFHTITHLRYRINAAGNIQDNQPVTIKLVNVPMTGFSLTDLTATGYDDLVEDYAITVWDNKPLPVTTRGFYNVTLELESEKPFFYEGGHLMVITIRENPETPADAVNDTWQNNSWLAISGGRTTLVDESSSEHKSFIPATMFYFEAMDTYINVTTNDSDVNDGEAFAFGNVRAGLLSRESIKITVENIGTETLIYDHYNTYVGIMIYETVEGVTDPVLRALDHQFEVEPNETLELEYFLRHTGTPVQIPNFAGLINIRSTAKDYRNPRSAPNWRLNHKVDFTANVRPQVLPPYVQIGDGMMDNNGANPPVQDSQFPVRLHAVSSYSQTIYLASELGNPDGGYITEIHYHFNGATAIHNENYQIWIGHTNDSLFGASASFVNVAAQSHTPVFNYDVNNRRLLTLTNDNQGENWIRIVLDTPFIYDGVSNIIITVQRTGLAMPAANRFFEERTGMTGRSIIYTNNTGSALTPSNIIPDTRLRFGETFDEANILITSTSTRENPLRIVTFEWPADHDNYDPGDKDEFTIRIRNRYTEDIVITGATLTGPNRTEFILPSELIAEPFNPIVIKPFESRDFAIEVIARGAGLRQARLDFNFAAVRSLASIDLFSYAEMREIPATPFTENFMTTDEHELPEGWYVTNETAGSVGVTLLGSSNRRLTLNNGATGTGNQHLGHLWVTTPHIPNIQATHVRIYVSATGIPSEREVNLIVGVARDPYLQSALSFPVRHIPVKSGAPEGFTISLPQGFSLGTPPHDRLYFRHPGVGENVQIHIDRVEFFVPERTVGHELSSHIIDYGDTCFRKPVMPVSFTITNLENRTKPMSVTLTNNHGGQYSLTAVTPGTSLPANTTREFRLNYVPRDPAGNRNTVIRISLEGTVVDSLIVTSTVVDGTAPVTFINPMEWDFEDSLNMPLGWFAHNPAPNTARVGVVEGHGAGESNAIELFNGTWTNSAERSQWVFVSTPRIADLRSTKISANFRSNVDAARLKSLYSKTQQCAF